MNTNITPQKLQNYCITRKYPNGWLFSLLPGINSSNEYPLTIFISIADLPKYGYNHKINNMSLSKSSEISNNKNKLLNLKNDINNMEIFLSAAIVIPPNKKVAGGLSQSEEFLPRDGQIYSHSAPDRL